MNSKRLSNGNMQIEVPADVVGWLDTLAGEIEALENAHEGMLCGALVAQAKKLLMDARSVNGYEEREIVAALAEANHSSY